MKIRKSTRTYEAWLAERVPLVEADILLKHQRMAESPFYFMRATFYRWAQLFPSVCEKLAAAPSVLSVGDLHIENFGTWRDAEGRLVWGINDFDEAFPAAYTNDLVRLVASAGLANEHHELPAKLSEMADAVLEGYVAGLEKGGEPFVLSERHGWLRDIAESDLRDPVTFWKKLDDLSPLSSVPKPVLALLRRAMPDSNLEFKVSHRVAGLGSLGRPRFVAVAEWNGGRIARELKALAPSAWVYAFGGDEALRYEDILAGGARARDPFLVEREGWITRRLSPHCSRIELGEFQHRRDEVRLLHAMGWETANVHLGTRGARKEIRKDLEKRGRSWLLDAARAMNETIALDWKAWRDAAADDAREAHHVAHASEPKKKNKKNQKDPNRKKGTRASGEAAESPAAVAEVQVATAMGATEPAKSAPAEVDVPVEFLVEGEGGEREVSMMAASQGDEEDGEPSTHDLPDELADDVAHIEELAVDGEDDGAATRER